MMENVKSVPSFATNFTIYAMPKVTVKPDGIGNVMVHVDCTWREEQPLTVVDIPFMKKSANVIGAAPSFLMVNMGGLVAFLIGQL
jgi:hypothetical protein